MRILKHSAIGLLTFITLVIISVPSSQAQISSETDFQSKVVAGKSATYLDLVRKVFPDVGRNSSDGAIAHKSIALSHFFGDYKDIIYQEEMKITGVENPGAQTRNHGQVLVLIHVNSDSGGLSAWNELSILTLFELEPSVKLLDAVDIQADKFSGFWDEGPVIQIGAQTDAVIISNGHHNSSQGYQSLTVVAPINDRLRNVFDLPVVLSSNDCGNNITQTAKIDSIKAAGNARFNLSVNIKSIRNPDDASCEKRVKGYTQSYKSMLVWNTAKGKYLDSGVELDKLEKFNKKRM